MLKSAQQLYSAFKITDNNDIEVILIELSKFKKTEQQCRSMLDFWCFFLKNTADLNAFPKALPEHVKSAYDAANVTNMSEADIELQRKKIEWIYINNSALSMAKAKGYASGLAKSKTDALQQFAKTSALNLIRMNLLNDEQIAQAMRLPLEQVNSMRFLQGLKTIND
jgi:predicted transposase/invertase (TIGR01784 family)